MTQRTDTKLGRVPEHLLNVCLRLQRASSRPTQSFPILMEHIRTAALGLETCYSRTKSLGLHPKLSQAGSPFLPFALQATGQPVLDWDSQVSDHSPWDTAHVISSSGLEHKQAHTNTENLNTDYAWEENNPPNTIPPNPLGLDAGYFSRAPAANSIAWSWLSPRDDGKQAP